MFNARQLAVLCMVASAVIGAALVANVDGYTVAPAARFWMTVALPGLTVLVGFLPSVKRRVPRV